MDIDACPPVEERKRNPMDIEDECQVCGEPTCRSVRPDEVVPEFEAELCNATFCSWACARDFCVMLAQHSQTQMAMVTQRFRSKVID